MRSRLFAALSILLGVPACARRGPLAGVAPSWPYLGRARVTEASKALVLSNVIDHHMTLPQAVVAPRIHHPALPDALGFEPQGFFDAVLDSLRARGHVVNPLPGAGDVEAIMKVKGGWIGVSDPRSGGGGAGY